MRERCADELASLPQSVKAISDPEPLPVQVSQKLEELQRKVEQRIMVKELGES